MEMCGRYLITTAPEAMRRFHAHLEPGGLLALPFMEFWRDGEPLSTDWQGPREA